MTKFIAGYNGCKFIDTDLRNNSEYINVLFHGVKNDGVTDNTETILRLLNSYSNLYFPKGSYVFSIELASKSGISIKGQSMKETIFIPASDGYCIKLNSTDKNMDNNHFYNFTLKNNSSFTSTSAIWFAGDNENDRCIFNNIIITNGFKYGLNLEGRCIWSIFENFWIDGCYNGLIMNGTGAKNLLTFNNVYIRSSKASAVILDGGDTTFRTISFNNCNFENNCRDTTISTQYTLKLTNFDELSFYNCYIENNSNKTSTTYAIYCDGTYNRCLNILNSLIWGQEYGIHIEGIVMSGTITGNRLINTTDDITIGISSKTGGGHEESGFMLAGNTLAHPVNKVHDMNMNTSVTTLNPLSLAYRHANNNATPNVKNCNIIMSWTSEAITNFLNGTNGQIVIVYVYGTASKEFSNGDYIQLMTDDSVTISKGETITFMLFGNKWIEINRNTKSSSTAVETKTYKVYDEDTGTYSTISTQNGNFTVYDEDSGESTTLSKSSEFTYEDIDE